MRSAPGGFAPQPSQTAHSELQTENARLQLLLNLSNRITSNLELHDLLQTISANIREVMYCEGVAIYLVDSASGIFTVHALDYPHGKGVFKEGLQLTPPINDPLRRAFDTLKPVIVNTNDWADIHPEGYKIAVAEGFKNHFFIPLASHGRALGVLAVGHTTDAVFTPDDIDFLSQASGQIAVALENALAYREISELRDKLAQENLCLRDVVETIPTIAWTVLPDGSIDFVNRNWREYSGLSAGETAGSGWQNAVHPEDLGRHLERWRASLKAGEPFENEVRFRRADGVYRWFLVRAVPLRDPQGKIFKWYGTSTDIEDRERSRQLESELAHINRVSLLGELAASLAHEINQPITGTIISADACLRWLTRAEPDLDEIRANVMRIKRDGQRAAEIIQRLRSFYKKDTATHREPVDVNEVVGEMLVLLRSEANRYSIVMQTELAAGLPKVLADRVQLQQVLINLMLNGIEAMSSTDDNGELTITSRLDDGQLVVSVSDTGVGLPADKMDQIFDSFFTTKPAGTGMGLSISRSIVASHGGRLWASNNEGRGATFHFSLPIKAGH